MSCVISYFYIEPQPYVTGCSQPVCCVISYFYIEPQLLQFLLCQILVVLYLTSTSNHNCRCMENTRGWLCYILLLHRTTTRERLCLNIQRLCYILLLHRTTTILTNIDCIHRLCYILLLHRTTTFRAEMKRSSMLCYILLLHRTTTYMR